MQKDLARGIRNLLLNCAGAQAGQKLLIVREDPALGWYDAALAPAIADFANTAGLTVEILEVEGPRNDPVPEVAEAADRNDITLFLARIGDQGRFEEPVPGKTRVMSYARDIASLASPFGTTAHAAMLAVKSAVNRILLDAGEIRFFCPHGTDMRGRLSTEERLSDKDVGMRRFPMGVHQPIPARAFSGRVVLTLPLTPTGSRVYDPPSLPLEGAVTAEIRHGRLTGFDGPADQIAKLRAHYDAVGKAFGLDPATVHSWHSGLHPANACRHRAAEDADRWSNNVFNNPRFLHLHTCGNHPPGEIAWMVQDPTVVVDGKPLWEAGALLPWDFPALQSCLEEWPVLVPLYDTPSQAIGV